jgi:hypothetical protein
MKFVPGGGLGEGTPGRGRSPKLRGRPAAGVGRERAPRGLPGRFSGSDGASAGGGASAPAFSPQLFPSPVEHALLARRQRAGVRLEQAHDLGVVASPAGVASL